MDLHHLRCFVAVAEELHFGRAARRLNLSQPPLSQHIRNLEADLGTTLFDRSNRRVALTESGRVLLHHAIATLTRAEEARRAVQAAASGMSGTLAVGFLHVHALSTLPELVARFRAIAPGVAMRLQEMSSSAQLAAIRDGLLDLGMMWLPIPSGSLNAATLWREPFLLALPIDHPLAGNPNVSLTSIAQEPFIAYARQAGDVGLSRAVTKLLLTSGVSPPVAQVANTIHTAVGLVGAGVGIAVVPMSARKMRAPRVFFTPVLDEAQGIDVGLVGRTGSATPVESIFRKVVTEFTPTDDPGQTS